MEAPWHRRRVVSFSKRNVLGDLYTLDMATRERAEPDGPWDAYAWKHVGAALGDCEIPFGHAACLCLR